MNGKHLGLRIETELKNRLSDIAKREDRTISSVARLAIINGLSFFDSGVSHPKAKKFDSGVCHPATR
jgi:predicted transcriptional regulator